MLQFTDQTGRIISLPAIPKRIISLVPSQSEMLWELGLHDELLGVTKFCIHPKELIENKTRVGGTKNLNLDQIRALKPDLIIGNKEENERSQIEILQKEFNVWMSDIYNLNDSLAMMKSIGEICGKDTEANQLAKEIKDSFDRLKTVFKTQSVAYFIWNKPYMLAAKNTFIDHVLSHLGFINAAAELRRYPELSNEDLQTVKPDLCFLSSEPFPFKEQHVTELQHILPNSKILIVDGEVFSWYGSRLLHLEAYVNTLIPIINAE